MPSIGTGFRTQVYYATGELTPLGAQVVVLNFKF